MFGKFYKKLLALLLVVLLSFAMLPAGYASGSGGGAGNDDYYQAVSQLISSTWEDSYFAAATLLVGGDILDVDGQSVKLNSSAEIVGGELMLPPDVFEALGEKTYSNTQSFSVSANSDTVSSRKNAHESGACFDVVFDDETGVITITDDYQTARLLARIKPGGEAPGNIGAVQTIAGPDGLCVFQFSTGEGAKAACEVLNASPDIEYAEPDRIISLDKADLFGAEDRDVFYPGQDEFYTPDGEFGYDAAYSHLGWGPGRIGSDLYLDYLIANNKQSAAVTVAVVDTGLDATHPYFSGRNIPGFNTFAAGDPIDGDGHGTHVSGTIIDVTIALPNVKIMPVKVLNDQGKGSDLTVATGIYWASDHSAQVINMSLGGPHSQSIDSATAYAIGKNVTVVVAAGNETDNAANHCPAHIDAAITVSAFDQYDKPAYFTNYGSCVDVAAPGVGIVSARAGGGTVSMQGTSMASPHVAGAAALLLCNDPALSPASVKAMICENVDPIVLTGDTKYYGVGILNIGKAAGEPSPEFLIANPPRITENIYYGARQVQLAIEYYDNGVITDVTSLTTFTSDNASVATVTNSGLVTVIGEGQGYISAGYNGKVLLIQVMGVNREPVRVLSTIPANGAVNVAANATISVTFNKLPVNAIGYTLTGPNGKHTDWYQQMRYVGTNTMMIYLADTLNPNSLYTFTMHPGDVTDANGDTLENDFVMTFTTGTFPVEPLRLVSSSPADGSVNVGLNPTITLTFNHHIIEDELPYLLEGPDGSVIGCTTVSRNYLTHVHYIVTDVPLQPLTEYKFTVPAEATESNFGTLDEDYVMTFTTGTGAPPVLVTSVTLPATARINVDEATTLSASVLPSNATNKTLQWSSSNTNIATVSSSGIVTGVAPGSATITARSTDGSNRSGTCAVTVILPPTGVTVTPGEATLVTNATRQLTAAVTPSNATNTITWSSGNTAVATVSAAGLVTARAPGIAVITAATINGLTATCVVTVPDTTPPVITLTGGSTISINRGTAFVEPGYRAIDNVDGDVTSKVVVSGAVNAEVIGTYILTYTVSDAAGNIAAATRTVNVLPNRASFSFSDKGKAGTSFNHSFTAQYPCTATITPTGVDSKTQITVTIKNAAGSTVFSSAFNTTASKTTDLAPGNYTATIRIDNANGNVTVGVNIQLAESETPPASPTVTGLEAAPPQVTVQAGASQTVSFTAVYSDGSRVAVTSGVSLVSSNTGIATVSAYTINGAAAGSAVVTASYDGVTVDIPVTVTPPAASAPTLSLIGSAQIVLHLGGSPYVEQGASAMDSADGDISSLVSIVSNVDTSRAGNYTVTYSVTNTAGLSAVVTRQVRVIAPETRTVPGRSYSFSPKGKQGESFTYAITSGADGNISLTTTVPNKTTVMVTVTNSANQAVFTETFAATATRSFQAPAGDYNVKFAIVTANGNVNCGLSITTPGGTELYFPLPEVPL